MQLAKPSQSSASADSAMVKEPEHYLPVEECGGSFEKGVCAGHIERLGKVAQSTMSNHLSVLQQAGLIQVQKYGQWSYFHVTKL